MRKLIEAWEHLPHLEAPDDEDAGDQRASCPKEERKTRADRGDGRPHRKMASGDEADSSHPLAWLRLNKGDAEEAVRATGHGLPET